MDVRLVHPFTCIVAGPTGCGKTTFAERLLRNATSLVNSPPEQITWCYGEWQPLYTNLAATNPNIHFLEGLPEATSFDSKTRNLVVIDDLMTETDERVTKLFTKKSHHCNTSVVYLVQNLFPKGKENRTISLNAQYMVLFKNPRDATQVVHLAKQMYPGRVKYMREAFTDATSAPYGYLFVDLRQETPEYLRLRANIFPDETQYTYVPKT